MKKAIAGLISVVVAVITVTACASSGGVMTATGTTAAKAKDFKYTTSDGTVTITDYTGKAKNVTIPGQIDGLPVTGIGDFAFINNQLASVTIPDSVTEIGYSAFSFNQLTSITIPDSVTEIGYSAFSSNQLTSVIIPDSVSTIGNFAFSNNQLDSVTIGNSVTFIGQGAFAANRLASVTIPANVDIQPSSFYTLLYIHYTANNRKADVYTFSLISDGGFDMAVSNDAVEITDYRGDAKEIAIPAQINGLPVTAIGALAFFGNQLTSVTIPNSVTTIGGSAFHENQLTSITIGANVAFEGESITGNFNTVYINANKAAGTYRSGNNGATWISYLIY